MDFETVQHTGALIAARYRIICRIGEGGMGVVYRVFDEQLQRPTAIKFLPPPLCGDADRMAGFKNEARALSALNHPNIITIYEVGEADAAPFIAMELVEGRTLRQRLRTGRLPLREALDIGLQVARALDGAHGKGIIHRDIKPENVMVRTDGYVKVLDFGLAALHPALEPGQSALTAGSFETVAPAVAGTPAYMSPEQIEGLPLDSRTDIFSLGVLLCEALTGTNPFARAGLVEIVSAIGQTPASAASVTVDLPPAARSIVLKTLQKDARQRYQTTTELAADLQRALTGLDAPAAGTVAIGSVPRRYAVAAALVIAAAGGSGFLAYRRSERRHWVREQATPEIAWLATTEKSASAFPLLQRAEQILPDDPGLARAAAEATRSASIRSSPSGAIVEVKDYLGPDEGWLRLGVTPLENMRIPSGYLRWKVSAAGAGESITAPPSAAVMNFDLDRAAKAPAGMVPVAEGNWSNSLAFLGWIGPYALPAFFVDRAEVTNRQYQEFVDKGGYEQRHYWSQPFVHHDRELTWAAAMEFFRDSTGRPGPSTWEAGHYPAGKGDFPVTGVSWFEAAAYAAFAGKSLPVLAQSYKMAPPELDRYIVRLSNLSTTLAPVAQYQGMGPFGTYDLIGNVREWSWNASADNERFLLGRQASSYGPEALSPFDRSPLNGLRCVSNSAPMPADAAAPRAFLRRDFAKAEPANDAVFRIYRALYAYDKTPLHANVEAVADNAEDWTKQKLTFDSAYGKERVTAFLFLPKDARPPFQTVVFFPSARVDFLSSSVELGDLTFMDFVVKSGRAVMYPIYEGLYERRSALPSLPGPTLSRDRTVDWSKDLGRSIDYLETRPDIDKTRIGYLGVSQGSAYGVILATLEERLKTVVLLDGGYFQHEHPVAGMDQADFAPRLTRPVLMVNGRFDATFPLASAQEPLFRMLGTPDADKRHVVFDTPHDVRLRRPDLIKEVLAWYDKYLGRVN